MAGPQLEELADAAREIRSYEGVIARMSKLPDSPLVCEQPGIHHRGFALPGMQVTGQVVVIHNANVGKWPHDSRHFFQEDDDIRIDDQGNLVGFVPFKEPTKVRFTLGDAGVSRKDKVFDLRTGEAILANNAGVFETSIPPGSGTLLYVGSQDDVRRVKGD